MFEGSTTSGRRVRQLARSGRRKQQRFDLERPDELLHRHTVERPHPRAVLESDRMGYPARHDDSRASRWSARRGQERTTTELRNQPYGTPSSSSPRCSTPRATPTAGPRSDRWRISPQRAGRRRRLLPHLLPPNNASLVIAGDIEPSKTTGAGRPVLRVDAERGRAEAAHARRAGHAARRAGQSDDHDQSGGGGEGQRYVSFRAEEAYTASASDLGIAAAVLGGGNASRSTSGWSTAIGSRPRCTRTSTPGRWEARSRSTRSCATAWIRRR